MKKIFSLSTLAIATTLALTACGGSSGDSKTNSNSQPVEKMGVFLDSAVQGLTVIQDGKTTTTNAEGKFSYNANGGALTFKIGELLLGSTSAKSVVTPADLQTDNQQVTRILQILQSVDNDNNLDNGIQIDENVAKRFVNGDFNTLVKQADDDKFATDLKAKLNTNQFVKTEDQAIEHFKKTAQSDSITNSPELTKVADKLVGYWQQSCDDGSREVFQLVKSNANTLVETGKVLKREYDNNDCTGQYTESTYTSTYNLTVKVIGQGNENGKEVTNIFLTETNKGKTETEFMKLLWTGSNSFTDGDLTMTKVNSLKFDDVKKEEPKETADASKVVALITGYWKWECDKRSNNHSEDGFLHFVKSGNAQFKLAKFVDKEYNNATCSGSPSDSEQGVGNMTWDIKSVTPIANGYKFTAIVTGAEDDNGKTMAPYLGNFEVTNTRFVDVDEEGVATRVSGF